MSNVLYYFIISGFIYSALFFDIYIPIMQVILFYLCIGRDPHGINFGVVNNETAPVSSDQVYGSKIFIDELSNTTFKLVSLRNLLLLTNQDLIFFFLSIT